MPRHADHPRNAPRPTEPRECAACHRRTRVYVGAPDPKGWRHVGRYLVCGRSRCVEDARQAAKQQG